MSHETCDERTWTNKIYWPEWSLKVHAKARSTWHFPRVSNGLIAGDQAALLLALCVPDSSFFLWDFTRADYVKLFAMFIKGIKLNKWQATATRPINWQFFSVVQFQSNDLDHRADRLIQLNNEQGSKTRESSPGFNVISLFVENHLKWIRTWLMFHFLTSSFPPFSHFNAQQKAVTSTLKKAHNNFRLLACP